MWKLMILILPLMAGCGEKAECSEALACAGFGEVCVAGSCVVQNCATSAQCDMENHCLQGECTPGCSKDTDCYPGNICSLETSTCEQAPCRSTTLDCGFKEFCNTATGECYEANGYYCGECVDDGDCGGNGNMCLGFGAYGDFCGVTCEVEEDCPQSFTCVGISDGNGNQITKQCITYCWLYITDDDDGAAAGGPPSGQAPPRIFDLEGLEPPTCESAP